MERRKAASEENEEGCLEQLQVIETGCGPRIESALLMDLLRRSPGLDQCLADPMEVPNAHNPLARVNAYQHRLQALRCEYANVRIRTIELEEQLAEARLVIARREKTIQYFESTLEEMRASRAWKAAEKCSRWCATISSWFQCLRGKVGG